MELQTGFSSILGPSNKCRAVIPHLIPELSLTRLTEYAYAYVVMERRWIYMDEVDVAEAGLKDSLLQVLEAKRFNARFDYIVTGGDPIILATLMRIIAPPTLTLLRWDKKRDSYFPFRLS